MGRGLGGGVGAASCWGEGGLAGDLNADLGVVAAGADAGVVGREKEAIGKCKLRKDALLFAGEAEVLAWVGVPARLARPSSHRRHLALGFGRALPRCSAGCSRRSEEDPEDKQMATPSAQSSSTSKAEARGD